MIYDVLKAYRIFLETKYSFETARTYTIRLRTLFEGQSRTSDLQILDFENILENMRTIKHKNYFSQTKNALLQYCEFRGISLPVEIQDSIRELEQGTYKKYRSLKTVDYRCVQKQIQHLRNKKLRLCFHVLEATGLRVSELAGITSSDCLISDTAITLYFTAKGGARERAIIEKDAYPALFRNIQEILGSIMPDEKLFYSAIHLQIKANEMGFACHDLRRAFAKLEYKKSRSKTEVMKKLRHTSLKNTNIYLRSRVII